MAICFKIYPNVKFFSFVVNVLHTCFGACHRHSKGALSIGCGIAIGIGCLDNSQASIKNNTCFVQFFFQISNYKGCNSIPIKQVELVIFIVVKIQHSISITIECNTSITWVDVHALRSTLVKLHIISTTLLI